MLEITSCLFLIRTLVSVLMSRTITSLTLIMMSKVTVSLLPAAKHSSTLVRMLFLFSYCTSVSMLARQSHNSWYLTSSILCLVQTNTSQRNHPPVQARELAQCWRLHRWEVCVELVGQQFDSLELQPPPTVWWSPGTLLGPPPTA